MRSRALRLMLVTSLGVMGLRRNGIRFASMVKGTMREDGICGLEDGLGGDGDGSGC